MAQTNEVVNPDVCLMRHQIIDNRIDAIEGEQQGIRDDIKEVRNLQKQILYAIIGVFGTSILILIGVIAGRAIDFKVFFP